MDVYLSFIVAQASVLLQIGMCNDNNDDKSLPCYKLLNVYILFSVTISVWYSLGSNDTFM